MILPYHMSQFYITLIFAYLYFLYKSTLFRSSFSDEKARFLPLSTPPPPFLSSLDYTLAYINPNKSI